MNRPRCYATFSSVLKEDRFFTQIDMELDKIHITKGLDQFFTGTLEEFKKLEKQDADFTSVYTDLLDMIEYLTEVFTKK